MMTNEESQTKENAEIFNFLCEIKAEEIQQAIIYDSVFESLYSSLVNKKENEEKKMKEFNEKMKKIKFDQSLKKVFKIIERTQEEKKMSNEDSVNFYLTIALRLVAAVHSRVDDKNALLDLFIGKLNLLREIKYDN